MTHSQEKNRKFTMLQRSFFLVFLSMIIVLAISLAAVLLVNNAYVTGKNDIYMLEKQEKLDQMMESLAVEIQIAEQQQLKLLADNKVLHIAYLRNEMEPYHYYSQTLEIVNRMKEITDDFRIVKGIWMNLKSIGLMLYQDGITYSIPLTETAAEEAAKQEMYADQSRVYIVRSLMDYQTLAPEELCTIILELDTSVMLERFSYLCLENERVLLSINHRPLYEEAKETDPHMQMVTSNADHYPLQASLQIGPTRYRLSSDEWLTSTYVIITAVGLLAGAFILYLYYRLYRPLELLLDGAFQHLERGELNYRIPSVRSGPFAGIYRTFNDAMERLEYLMDHVYRQKLLISEMQLKQLQAQINPHFMYNTYYTLYRQIQDGNWANSRQLARLLGDFYQYITRTGSMEKSLREEVQHTLTYVEIQTMRFPDTVQEIEPLPEEIGGMLVPQLIMQPVFENVFQHAKKNLHPGEPLHLIMRYIISEAYVDVCIENNGRLSEETIRQLQHALAHVDDQEEITGLLNIHKRLQLFFGEEAGLAVSRSKLDGLCVQMRLIR